MAAHRAKPPSGWEFPGGKVESGETDGVALARELHEELGISVRAVRLLGTVSDDRIELALWHAELVSGSPVIGVDHDQLRWLGVDDLDALDWLPLDRELLASVRSFDAPRAGRKTH